MRLVWRLAAAIILATMPLWVPFTGEVRVVKAATSQDVIISATPDFAGVIGLEIRDLGGIGLTANWTLGGNLTDVLLLVSRNGYPTTATLNYEVAYAGNLTSVNLTGYSVNNTAYYFSIFPYLSGAGKYSTTYETAQIGTLYRVDEEQFIAEEDMEQVANSIDSYLPLLVIALVLILAYWRKAPLLFVIAGLGCMLYAYNYWDNVWYLSLILVLLGIFSFVTAFVSGSSSRRRRT